MNEQELKHYGVKGMKWGVRRSIGAHSRAAARLKSYINKSDKQISKLNKKRENVGLTDKQQKKLNIANTGNAIAKNLYKEHVKNLSPKDIKKGERAVRAMGLFGVDSVQEITDMSILSREEQRQRNRPR